MTITNLILCLVAGFSFAYAKMMKSESDELWDEVNDLAYKNYDLEAKIRLLNEDISSAIQEADENETWG